MIQLFRKIRQKLLAENRFNRYLIYAIGEILLVVIGILIALQVNNWNESRNSKSFEITLLVELRRALQDDIRFFEDHLINKRAKVRQETHSYFSKMIRGDVVDSSLFARNVTWLQYGNTFQVNDGAYESIKSAGLDKISNKEIRSYISKLYEFDIERYKSLIDYSTGELLRTVEQEVPPLLKNPIASFENDELIIESPPTDFNTTNNPHFLRLLKESISFEENTTKHYMNMVSQFKELISLIEAELPIDKTSDHMD